MNLKEMARSLSFRKCSSSRYAESSILSENLSSQSMKFTKYEDLSKSMRMEEGFVMDDNQPECYGDMKGERWSGSFRWRTRSKSIQLNGRKSTAKFSFDVFPQKPLKVADEMKDAKAKVKKKSSWLPDPSRRWPVQGW